MFASPDRDVDGEQLDRTSHIAELIGLRIHRLDQGQDGQYAACLFLDLLSEYFLPAHVFTPAECRRLAEHKATISHINNRFCDLACRLDDTELLAFTEPPTSA